MPSSARRACRWARLAGRVDVAWPGTAGVTVRSRVGGTWDAPVAVSADPAADVDLVRDGSTLHLAFGSVDETGVPAGVGYAVDDGSGWAVETVDAGQDRHPRLAVDADGAPHVVLPAGLPGARGPPRGQGRGDVADGRRRPGLDMGGARDRRGRGRATATSPWAATARSPGSGTRRTGRGPGPSSGSRRSRPTVRSPWSPVRTARSPSPTPRSHDADGALLADRAVWLKTGSGGAWTTRRIATNTGSPAVSLARGATGRLYVGFSTAITGKVRIAVATNASGIWVTAYATPGAVATRDTSPSIAVDAHGKVQVAYEERTPATSASSIRYVTNATGTWVRSLISSGSAPRVGPRLALTSAGEPRIAYWIEDLPGGSLGIRLASRTGTSWSTQVITNDHYDASPALAVDPQGHAHLLWARGVTYGVCWIPFCAEAPGLVQWTDAPGFGAARRVTDHAEDGSPALVRGADGSIQGAFAAPAWRMGTIDLWEPTPAASALGVHLAASGTVAPGMSRLAVTFTGRHAAKFRLAQQVGGGTWHTAGSVTASTARSLSVPLSPTTTRRFRVTAYDGLGRTGNTVTGATIRIWGHSEAPGSGVAYSGSWSTAHKAAFWGGAARVATSSSAAVTWTVTAREVAGRRCWPRTRATRGSTSTASS